MSLREWKKEFYPVSAVELANVIPTDLEMLRHVLKKWLGLRPAAMEKHGLQLVDFNFLSDGVELLPIDGSTCALCEIYLNPQGVSRCLGCPLNSKGLKCTVEYKEFYYNGNPEPMIQLLESAISGRL